MSHAQHVKPRRLDAARVSAPSGAWQFSVGAATAPRGGVRPDGAGVRSGSLLTLGGWRAEQALAKRAGRGEDPDPPEGTARENRVCSGFPSELASNSVNCPRNSELR